MTKPTAADTILITGGASGIGLALAKRYAASGSTVVICGRREEQLALARKECPQLNTFVADVSMQGGREWLVDQAVKSFPGLNILINNAGIQNRPPRSRSPRRGRRTRLRSRRTSLPRCISRCCSCHSC